MRVSILFVTGLFFLAIAASSGAYTKPKDVYGWENLKWGMSASEVESVLGKGIKKRKAKHDMTEGVYTDLEMRDINIGGREFRASFWMDEDTKELSKIVFVPQSKAEGYNMAETFIKLEESLVDKYGDPDVEKTSNDPGTSAERIWNFPSTEIEMSYLKIGDTELLLLIFSERENDAN
jgi:hypothetical protein